MINCCFYWDFKEEEQRRAERKKVIRQRRREKKWKFHSLARDSHSRAWASKGESLKTREKPLGKALAAVKEDCFNVERRRRRWWWNSGRLKLLARESDIKLFHAFHFRVWNAVKKGVMSAHFRTLWIILPHIDPGMCVMKEKRSNNKM